MSANLSPNGLHAVEPEPDFSEQYAEQQSEARGGKELSPDEKVRAVALAILARNKGSVRKTAREVGVSQAKIQKWKQESVIENPFEEEKKPAVTRVRVSANSDLAHAQKKLVQVINTIVDNLPKMLVKASLTEQVKTLNQLVSIKGDVDTLLTPPAPPGLTSDELREMAKKKLEMKKKELDKTGE